MHRVIDAAFLKLTLRLFTLRGNFNNAVQPVVVTGIGMLTSPMKPPFWFLVTTLVFA